MDMDIKGIMSSSKVMLFCLLILGATEILGALQAQHLIATRLFLVFEPSLHS